MVAPRGTCVVAPGGHGCSRGACMVAPSGHAWLLLGACMVAPGGCVAKGGCAWQRGACVVKGVCMVKEGVRGEGGMCGMHPTPHPHEIRPVIARAVRILLECILVIS